MKEILTTTGGMIIETIEDHANYAHAFAYAIAKKEASLRDEYMLLHIKPRPVYIPDILWKKMLKELLHVTLFKK